MNEHFVLCVHSFQILVSFVFFMTTTAHRIVHVKFTANVTHTQLAPKPIWRVDETFLVLYGTPLPLYPTFKLPKYTEALAKSNKAEK